MEKETRLANIIFNKPGGTASKNSVTTRVVIPFSWIREMGITQDCRSVTLVFDPETKEIRVKRTEG